MAKAGYYVVWQGEKPGIYTSRNECEPLVVGYRDAKYKKFATLAEAKEAFAAGYEPYYGQKPARILEELPIELDSIAVDAACAGNPGVVEYQGIDLTSQKTILYRKLPRGTNNIGEYLAIVDGFKYLTKHHLTKTLYSDSKIAINWVRTRRFVTKCPYLEEYPEVTNAIEEAKTRLASHQIDLSLLKRRDSSEWGEIPADFGRK